MFYNIKSNLTFLLYFRILIINLNYKLFRNKHQFWQNSFLVCFYLNNLKTILKINLLVFYTLIFFLLIILRQDISRDLFLIMRLPFFKDISFLFRCVLLPTSNLIKFLFLRAPISLFIMLLIWFYFFFSTLLYVTLLVFIAFHDTR